MKAGCSSVSATTCSCSIGRATTGAQLSAEPDVLTLSLARSEPEQHERQHDDQEDSAADEPPPRDPAHVVSCVLDRYTKIKRKAATIATMSQKSRFSQMACWFDDID